MGKAPGAHYDGPSYNHGSGTDLYFINLIEDAYTFKIAWSIFEDSNDVKFVILTFEFLQ